MFKKSFYRYILIAIVVAVGFYEIIDRLNSPSGNVQSIRALPFNPPELGDLQTRVEWERTRLVDPANGRIPEHIRMKELGFASSLPRSDNFLRMNTWEKRGPFNVGGRTRAAALDVSVPGRILAGSVSGGIWESPDDGQSWVKLSANNELLSVTSLVQDLRAGKEKIWYYGTGEGYGNSASGPGAFFAGNGVYKSTDNGKSWQSLSATASNTVQFDKLWDIVWKLALDSSRHDSDIVFAATLGAIFRSNDGGNTWTKLLGGSTSAFAYFSDVMVCPDGSVYATLSNDGPDKGFWHAQDGIHFLNITPLKFPPEFKRIVMDFNPQNPTSVYFLAHTQGYGKLGLGYKGKKDWNSLWKYNFINRYNNSERGHWTDLSENIPAHSKKGFDDFNAQGSYNLAIKFYPWDSNYIFLGGTNIYRSSDGFLSDSNTVQIGGYAVHTQRPYWKVYLNHHPDQHVILFHASKKNYMYNFNDGGAFFTEDCKKDTVIWTPLNNGYQTTQVYTINFEENASNDILIAGFQDNGNYFVNSTSPDASWVMPMNGDGSYSAIGNNHKYYIFSSQLGKMAKFELDDNGIPKQFTRIDPIGGQGYLFINPFAIDPNDEDILYLPAGTHLWRNNKVTTLPYLGNFDSISTAWSVLSDTIEIPNRNFTCLAVSKSNPEHRLYLGTNSRYLYRVDNANTGDPQLERINHSKLAAGYVSSITVDPYDGNKLLVAYSNYGVVSIVSSEDGGDSWTRVAGNLEEVPSGNGNGPSVRSVAILYLPDGKLYFAGTSVGLFATDTLKGEDTYWQQVAADDIGNVVVEMVKTRNTDGLVVVGTHGLGIFSARLHSIGELLGVEKENNKGQINVYPNPTSGLVTVTYVQNTTRGSKWTLFDLDGHQVDQGLLLNSGYVINLKNREPGVYLIRITGKSGNSFTEKIILKR